MYWENSRTCWHFTMTCNTLHNLSTLWHIVKDMYQENSRSWCHFATACEIFPNFSKLTNIVKDMYWDNSRRSHSTNKDVLQWFYLCYLYKFGKNIKSWLNSYNILQSRAKISNFLCSWDKMLLHVIWNSSKLDCSNNYLNDGHRKLDKKFVIWFYR